MKLFATPARAAALVFSAALACTAQAQPGAEAFSLADCQGPLRLNFARTLVPAHASVAALPAQALWLDARRLRWPQAEAGMRTRLLFSARGQLQAAAGRAATGMDEALLLEPHTLQLPPALRQQHGWLGPGPVWRVPAAEQHRLRALHRGQLLLVQEDAAGQVLRATAVQHAPALDALYADAAERLPTLGATVAARTRNAATQFRVWAPTAQQVALCLHADGRPGTPAQRLQPLQRDNASGAWQWREPRDLSGQTYTYLVDVYVPGTGLVRQRVTDPYSLSLNADSQRSWIGHLDDPRTQPAGWAQPVSSPRPPLLAHPTRQVIYELHVRDFSVFDETVRPAWRGKYLAFAEPESDGVRHLRALQAAGVTDIHLLPIFDLATVPETGCIAPPLEALHAAVQAEGPASETPQAWVAEHAARDCYNWGYDPWHFNAPEGSFASDAHDGAVRVRELRAMVQALHRAGLRVGMDVVYNHTTAAGQAHHAVLDRVVPGYYQRLNAQGQVERSTCCDNTATEHRMMARLMIDSAVIWARDYRIDSFRFDLMGHQPRAAMERLQRAVDRAAGRRIHLIGEGWNFGEVADGKRFLQASQLSLPGSGIATFSDRARDAVRGGSAGDSGAALLQRLGWVHGPQAGRGAAADAQAYARQADLVRAGLAGTLRDYLLPTHDGSLRPLREVDYAGQPAGYVAQPGEVVNYVENHDNLTLFDSNVFKLPPDTPPEERARVQLLALATTAFSQGIAYLHAGSELLRSKSLDRNSYDSGDWFNRIDWTLQDNYYATGLPPRPDNQASWPQMAPLLGNPGIKPRPEDMRFTRDATLDLLRIRSSTPLFTLPTSAEVQRRLRFLATGPGQPSEVIVGHLDGRGLRGAGFAELLYALNAAPQAQTLQLPGLRGRALRLHPVHLAPGAADRRPVEAARWDAATGTLTVPARTALVYVGG